MVFTEFDICDYLDNCDTYDYTQLGTITIWQHNYSTSSNEIESLSVYSLDIPFFIYIALAIPIIFVFNRLIIEWTIRLRSKS